MTRRTIGILLGAYAVVYAVQFIASPLYDAQPVWNVVNYLSALAIVAALALNARSRDFLLAANVALAVWFFRNWFGLLALDAGESVSTHADVLWYIIAGLIPAILGATAVRATRAL